MNKLELAIYATAHDCSLGTLALAEALGMSRQILLNKADPNKENAYFSPQQLINLQRITGDYSINDALVAKQELNTSKGASIVSSLLSMSGKVGKLSDTANKALEDGVINSKESLACLKAASEVEEVVQQLKNRLLHENTLRVAR